MAQGWSFQRCPDLVVSSMLAHDATHDVDWYFIFPTTLFHVVVIRRRAGHVRPCSRHAKRWKWQEHTGRWTRVAAMENGERVAFVEADPQGTTSKWGERRGNPYPRVVRVSDPADIVGGGVESIRQDRPAGGFSINGGAATA
jgi:hypothetical protein